MTNDDVTSTDLMLRKMKALRGCVAKEKTSIEPFSNELAIKDIDASHQAPHQKVSPSIVDILMNCFAPDTTKKNKPQS